MDSNQRRRQLTCWLWGEMRSSGRCCGCSVATWGSQRRARPQRPGACAVVRAATGPSSSACGPTSNSEERHRPSGRVCMPRAPPRALSRWGSNPHLLRAVRASRGLQGAAADRFGIGALCVEDGARAAPRSVARGGGGRARWMLVGRAGPQARLLLPSRRRHTARRRCAQRRIGGTSSASRCAACGACGSRSCRTGKEGARVRCFKRHDAAPWHTTPPRCSLCSSLALRCATCLSHLPPLRCSSSGKARAVPHSLCPVRHVGGAAGDATRGDSGGLG